MPSNGVTIKSPLKGVQGNATWVDHDPDFALDALNVLPFGVDGRNRVAQRPGTDKLYAAVLGSGLPVLALEQTSIPLDPSTASATTVVFSDDFSYASGDLGTVGSANWTGFGSSQIPGTQSSTDATAWFVNPSGYIVPKDNFQLWTAVYNGSGSVGNAYTVKAKVQFNGSSTTMTTGVGFITRVLPSNGFTIAQTIVVCMNQHHVTVYQSGSGTVLASQTASRSASTDYALELRVTHSGSSSTYTVFVDNTQVCQATGIADVSTNDNGIGVYNNGTTNVQIDNFQILIKQPKAVYRQTNVLAVAGGNVYVGDTTSMPVATNGTGVIAVGVKPQFAYSAGKGWFVDGASIVQVDIASATVETYTATAGTAPSGCTLAAMYRDRLVLAAPYSSPHLFFCSRVGTQADWDYAQLDSAAAFAGNASTAGHLGDPITALMPGGDDVLYIGGDHTLYAMRGDPADGGSIDLVSDSIGVLGPNAWTKAPDGTIYFVGSGGLYRLNGGAPENLSSGTWNEFFRQIDRAVNYITLEWDRDRQGLYVFIAPAVTGAARHLFWDARGMGFWPVQYPDSHGPLSALVYDGDAAADRVMLLGGRTGYVQRMQDQDLNDDGTAISSFVAIGPYTDNDETENTGEWFDVILGEPSIYHTAADWNLTVQVRAGPTPERAFNTPERSVSRTYAGVTRRQTRWRQRIRGTSFVVKLSNAVLSKTWAFERIVAMMLPSGLVRRNQ